MKRRKMMLKFLLLCLLLRFDARGEDQLRRIPRRIDGSRICNFNEVRTNYNATDLLECIDELAVDLAVRESSRLLNGKNQWDLSTGRQISFMDIFTRLFDKDPAAPHHGGSLPVNPTSGYQQSNYPAGTVGLSPGFQLNLLEALSTISRHDDYKCVPRILCEMASGKLPGRSLGKQGSGFFEFLAGNAFTNWLARFDVAGASPLLNFARAMILGYGNRGNPAACYHAFPRCPRNANDLVYYLNNYRGGFFRLFNKHQAGNYGGRNGVPGPGVEEVKERVVTGSSKDSFHNAPGQNRFQFPAGNYGDYYEKEEQYPRYEPIEGGNEIIFPQRENSGNEATNVVHVDTSNVGSIFRGPKNVDGVETTRYVQNDIRETAPDVWRDDNVPFFPRGRDQREFTRFRFPTDYDLISTD